VTGCGGAGPAPGHGPVVAHLPVPFQSAGPAGKMTVVPVRVTAGQRFSVKVDAVDYPEGVGDELLKRHRFWRDIGTVGEPGAALLPPGHREVIFQARGVPLGQEILRQAAMQAQQHRMCGVCALDEHPLPHAVDIGKNLL